MTSRQPDGSSPNRSRKHVVLVGPAYPFRGGIAQFTDSMARGMRRRGYDVSLITFSRQYPSVLFPGKSQYEIEAGRERAAAEVIDSINPVTWRAAARDILGLNPSVVIFQYWLPFFAPSYGTIAGQLKKRAPDARILTVAHNVLPHERRPGDKLMARYFLRKCDGIVALSAAVAEDARSLAVNADIRTLSHPVYAHFGEAVDRTTARSHLRLPDNADILLFFGFVRAYKGLKVLLKAMPTIAEARPNVHLVVAGEFYDDKKPYQEIIRSHGLEQRVHLYSEYVPEADVSLFFSAADLVVQPYVSATQSGVVQTAFHFNRPVVVTDVGGLAEVVPHEVAGLVVPPDDPNALASAVVRYFEDDMEDRLVAGVRREKAKYGWDAFLDGVEDLTA